MPEYRRWYVLGGTYFFTVVTHRRRPFLTHSMARQILHTAIREVRRDLPFTIDAFVLLPDHLHTLWTLPTGDADYPRRWRASRSSSHIAGSLEAARQRR